jgi:hypothetical protein
VRKQAIYLLRQRFSVVRYGFIQGCDFEVATAGKSGVGQLVGGGQPFHGRRFSLQYGQPGFHEVFAVGFDRQIAHCPPPADGIIY